MPYIRYKATASGGERISEICCVYSEHKRDGYWLCSKKRERERLHVVVITMHGKYVKNIFSYYYFWIMAYSNRNLDIVCEEGMTMRKTRHGLEEEKKLFFIWWENFKEWSLISEIYISFGFSFNFNFNVFKYFEFPVKISFQNVSKNFN